MSASQRRKGQAGEREACAKLAEAFGGIIKRRLSQVRDGEQDIDLPPLRIEVKRRARIGNLYEWMAQCETGAKMGEIPTLMIRADGKDWIVALRFDDFCKLAREEVAHGKD